MNLAYHMPRLMAEIASAVTPGRTEMDRYREFRQVFYGTDAGRRVLNDIMYMGGIYTTSPRVGEPYTTLEREGGRKVVLKIAERLEVEPHEPPTHQVTRKGGERPPR